MAVKAFCKQVRLVVLVKSLNSTQANSATGRVPCPTGLAIFIASLFFLNLNPHLLSEIQVVTLSIEFSLQETDGKKGLEGFCGSAEQPKPQRAAHKSLL